VKDFCLLPEEGEEDAGHHNDMANREDEHPPDQTGPKVGHLSVPFYGVLVIRCEELHHLWMTPVDTPDLRSQLLPPLLPIGHGTV
jgi:hypothetical protein